MITIIDSARKESKIAISKLREEGIENIIMLTGDNDDIAQAIARELGIKQTYSQLLPEQKVEVVKELFKRYGSVGMIGDGINDAPALAVSSVGIAMGTAGTDVAIETENIVLISDNLSKVLESINLSKRVTRMLVFLILGGMGFANLWMAILADDGATLIVILNGLRLLKSKR